MSHCGKIVNHALVLLISFSLVSACGPQPPTESRLLDNDSPGATFGIGIDSNGNVSNTFRPDKRLEIGLNGFKKSRSEVDRDESKSFSSKKEKLDADCPATTPKDDDPLVIDNARIRDRYPENTPQYTLTTKIDIESERFQNAAAANATFNKQMNASKENLANHWRSARASFVDMKKTIKTLAFLHNQDVYRTLDFTSNTIKTGIATVGEYKASRFSDFGKRLYKMSGDISNAWTELPQKFSGESLKSRTDMLKIAGNSLKIADAYFAEGDFQSAEYLLNMARTLVDVAISVVPIVSWVKDTQEALTGYSYIYQRDLTTEERAFAVVGSVTAGVGSKVLKVGQKLKVLTRLFKTAEDAKDGIKAIDMAKMLLKVP